MHCRHALDEPRTALPVRKTAGAGAMTIDLCACRSFTYSLGDMFFAAIDNFLEKEIAPNVMSDQGQLAFEQKIPHYT